MKVYKTILVLLLVLVVILAISLTSIKTVSAEKALTVTVSTNKPVYTIGEAVNVTFYVTSGGKPVQKAGVRFTVIHDDKPGMTYNACDTDSDGKTIERWVNKPIGNHRIKATASKQGYTEAKGEASFEVKVIKRASPEAKEKEVKKRIFGRVFLDDTKYKYPYGGVRNAKVELEHKGNTYKNYTDDGGFFEFDAEVKKDDQITLTLYLEDEVDGKNYIKILDKQSTNPLHPVYIEKTRKTTDEDLRSGINFDFDKKSPASGYRSGSSSSALPGLVKEYIIFEDAVEFALEKLKANIKSVSVYTNDPNPVTTCGGYGTGDNVACYSDGKIYLGESYIRFCSDQKFGYNSPTVEFHEFGHHIMASQFEKKWPSNQIPHGGMLNPTTHDSLEEGEAEFFALLMMDYKNLHGNKIGVRYATSEGVLRGVNYEVNIKAWHCEQGLNREDQAVTSLLWDLYDPGRAERLDDKYFFLSQNEVYDVIDFSLKDIWSIIKDPSCQTVLDLHGMLISKYPLLKDDINNSFIAHGFFRDKDTGDGEYNGSGVYKKVTAEGELEQGPYFGGEPFNDTINNKIRDPGERFVDLGRGHRYPGGQVYDTGDDIGTAGTHAMPKRQTWQILESSQVLVKNEGVVEFLINVEFEPEYSYYNFEYLANSHEGLLYISFPPPEYTTTVAITPIYEGELAAKPLEIESGEYFDLISRSTGKSHFLELEFVLKPIKEAYVLGLTFESRSKPSGSSLQIPLTLKGIDEKIGNMDLTLGYDPSVLEATEVIKGGLTANSVFDYNILNQGTIKISLADMEGFSGDGSIAYVKFNVIGSEGSSSPLQIVSIAANRAEDDEALEIPTIDGVFRVISMEEGRGDSDGDGEYTALDALCILQMAVEKIPEDLVMDVNGDGSITSIDARKILRIAVGIESK